MASSRPARSRGPRIGSQDRSRATVRPRLRCVRRRVTFSRNLTLSLSRTCRCYCKYCAFATHRTHLHAPDAVLRLLDGAARRNVKELLVLTGEHPEVDAGVRALLREYGHEDFVAYVVWACERALERGLLPHTNLGVLDSRRARAAARGDGVAGAHARVRQSRTWSRTRARRRSIRSAGWRRSARPASCGSRSRAGSSSASARARTSASRRSRRSPPSTPSTATCRRSSCRTSSRTTATTAASRPRSPMRPRAGAGRPGSATRRTARCRAGRRRSRSTSCSGSSASAAG